MQAQAQCARFSKVMLCVRITLNQPSPPGNTFKSSHASRLKFFIFRDTPHTKIFT